MLKAYRPVYRGSYPCSVDLLPKTHEGMEPLAMKPQTVVNLDDIFAQRSF